MSRLPKVGSHCSRPLFLNLGLLRSFGLQLPEAFTTSCPDWGFWELQFKSIWITKVKNHCLKPSRKGRARGGLAILVSVKLDIKLEVIYWSESNFILSVLVMGTWGNGMEALICINAYCSLIKQKISPLSGMNWKKPSTAASSCTWEQLLSLIHIWRCRRRLRCRSRWSPYH